jgi:hypothetical protein
VTRSLYRPSWLAHRWQVSPQFLHRMCRERGLARLCVNPTKHQKSRRRLPQPTVDALAKLLERERIAGGETGA